MKKEFIYPEVEVIELEAQEICAGSTPGEDMGEDQTIPGLDL